MGPIDYSTNYSCGLLVDGFDSPPRLMMNHNPPYYIPLLESWDLEKARDLWAWWFTVDDYLLNKWGPRIKRFAESASVRIRPFNLKDSKAEIMRCKSVYNGAWVKNWGFVRMTDSEFTHFASGLLDFVPPEMLMIAEVKGEPVGFTLLLPDFNEALRTINGRLFKWGLPLGLLKFRRESRKIKTGRLLALGVLEKFRRRGITEMLILSSLEAAKNIGHFSHTELGWTLEDNTLINRTIEAVGAKVYKTYRIYSKSIA